MDKYLALKILYAFIAIIVFYFQIVTLFVHNRLILFSMFDICLYLFNVLFIAPPLCINRTQLLTALEIISEIISDSIEH